MARQKSYHHGDLRQALLENGLSLLEEGGIEALSLRKIAARVGVSHAAPEHHFKTVRDLMSAMSAEGFKLFGQAMREAMARAETDQKSQFRAAFEGYLAFATKRPHLFRLMFSSDRLDWCQVTLLDESKDARDVLSEISLPVARRLGLDTPEGRLWVEELVWSQVHGRAHLMIDGKISSPGHHAVSAPAIGPDFAALIFPD